MRRKTLFRCSVRLHPSRFYGNWRTHYHRACHYCRRAGELSVLLRLGLGLVSHARQHSSNIPLRGPCQQRKMISIFYQTEQGNISGPVPTAVEKCQYPPDITVMTSRSISANRALVEGRCSVPGTLLQWPISPQQQGSGRRPVSAHTSGLLCRAEAGYGQRKAARVSLG